MLLGIINTRSVTVNGLNSLIPINIHYPIYDVILEEELIPWNRTYGGNKSEGAFSVIQTSDGGFALTGYTDSFGAGDDDFWLVKTNSQGEMEWNQTYGGSEREQAYSVMQTHDGGYAVAGYTWSFGPGTFWNFWLVKTDSQGKMEWERAYGRDLGAHAFAATHTLDGGFILAGRIRANWEDFWVVKTDMNGTMEWNHTYGGFGDDVAYTIIQTADEGFAVAGSTHSHSKFGADDCWLIKINGTGDVEWDHTYGGFSTDVAYALSQTSDKGFALVGRTHSYGDERGDFLFIKTDQNGTLLWQKVFGGIEPEEARAVIQTPDNGFLITGKTSSYGFGRQDIWILKIDSHGEVLWNQTYGGSSNERSYSIIQAEDGGFVVAGLTASYTAAYSDYWLIKIPSDFTLPELTSPLDISYIYGTTGHYLEWEVGDQHPGTYQIIKDSDIETAGTWTNGTIKWNVDNLSVGIYEYEITVFDVAMNSRTDIVQVTVTINSKTSTIPSSTWNSSATKTSGAIAKSTSNQTYGFTIILVCTTLSSIIRRKRHPP